MTTHQIGHRGPHAAIGHALIDALAQRDAVAAETAMAKHLERIRADIFDQQDRQHQRRRRA